ncbi:Putative ankyrin repeat-containing domain superfamily [Septoria linicola]|uniref:Ankyrin repeat-containing domain superfamily n=1 Tax=Septoria linicola TaxID=215465 RepID=A0A9Q9ASU9_9PEZI|nr:putative ankyrin repeat-containing domain superfamily [Septoria linicola]USW54039.1 Putative ankyrin repeat-containing domain superfamily [Septoria linicola]
MAPVKKETLLEQCTGVIAIGNGIAVHILEYLSIVKEAPHGFRELAIEFLETSRALFPAKAGLSRSTAKFQPDVTAQLQQKFLLTKNAFIVLDQVVNKFLSNEKKQSFGKFGRGFRMMFADSEIDKLRLSLSQCKSELSISTLMFSSILGDSKVDAATAIGYTALAAILELPDPTLGNPGGQKDAYASLSPDRRALPPVPAPLSFAARDSSLHTVPTRTTSSLTPEERSQPRYPELRGSGESGKTTTASSPLSPMSDRSSVMMQPGDNGSDITSIMSMFGEHENLTQYHDRISKNAIRIQLDPSQVHRRAPSKRSIGGTPESARLALATALQQKDTKMVEHLLDSGVHPDAGLFREALITHDLPAVRLFLLYGADANTKDKDGSTPLYTATGSSFFEAAQLLVKYGGDPNVSTGPYGESPFAVSLTNSKAHFAQLYLQQGGADPNQEMGNGETAFTQSMNKHTPATLVELMLAYDADPNVKNARGETPLFKAITSERHDLVTYLLTHKADPNMPGPKIVLWPAVHQPHILQILLEHKADMRRAPGVLELATSINSRKAIDILLKHGADVNAKKDGIYTPLCSAIRDNHEDLVERLLQAGADPNLPALEHPIYKCVTYHRTHILPMLLQAGADLNKPKGIIEHAVAHDDQDALVYLLDHKVDINARSAAGHTALTTAIRENKMDLIDFLLGHGADPAVRGQDWPISLAVKNPQILAKLLPYIPTSKIIKGILEMAVVADQLESVKMLVAKGVDVEEKNGGVFSPLTTSIRENRKDIFRYLVDEAGADVNAPGEHLPIIKAIRRHREDDMSYIRYLIQKGSDINLMYRGWNAVLQAVDNGDTQILQLLAKEGHPDLSARGEDGKTVLEVMHERGLDEEERILLGGRSPSPQMKVALSSLRDLVL